MACPHVSGVAAQYLQRNPQATPAEVHRSNKLAAPDMRQKSIELIFYRCQIQRRHRRQSRLVEGQCLSESQGFIPRNRIDNCTRVEHLVERHQPLLN